MLRTKSIDDAVAETNARSDFYGRAEGVHLAPLWRVLAGLVPAEPKPQSVAHLWRYKDARPFLLEAAELISEEEAERRVMILENPGLPGQSRIAESLFCGFQIIMPGEMAPGHRHTSGAIRFIIEGCDAYTAINGERTMMEPGDFVMTPSWTMHDHANVGNGPMVWMDALDMHMVNLFNASFREEDDRVQQDYSRPDDVSIGEFAHGIVPGDHEPLHNASPVINYKYGRTREVLTSMQSYRQIDKCLGHLVKYRNPVNGDWAMPTMAAQMRLLPAGFETVPYQATDATAFSVVEGHGYSEINGQTLAWEKGDVFLVPSWAKQVHRATTEAVLFSISDRAAQEKLGMWREHRIAN